MRLIFSLGLIAALALCPAYAMAGPQLFLPATEVEVGQVYQGQLARAVFEVQNPGDAELVIKSVKPG